MQPDTIQQLLTAYIDGTLSEKELPLLRQVLADDSEAAAVQSVLENLLQATPAADSYAPQQWNGIAKNILSADKIQPAESSRVAIPSHRIHFLKTSWFRYAAAVVLLTGISFLIKNIYRHNQQAAITRRIAASYNNDALPGGDKAVLTLADGTSIVLDSASDGQLAHRGNISIVKQQNGQLQFIISQQDTTAPEALTQLNTITTPRGGQYQVQLSDGSRVWLNAATSLRFPTTFTGAKRQVQLDGEAYFEVAKNASRPFEATAGNSTVEVLGTHFNVNAYTNEKVVTTTLLEGKVAVSTNGKSATLLPGHQSRLSNGNLSINQHPDVDEAIAWKEGRFQFSGADVETIMRQISRWYGVEVNYTDGVPSAHITGEIPRTLTLRQVMEVLKESGIQIWLETNNQLYVAPGP